MKVIQATTDTNFLPEPKWDEWLDWVMIEKDLIEQEASPIANDTGNEYHDTTFVTQETIAQPLLTSDEPPQAIVTSTLSTEDSVLALPPAPGTLDMIHSQMVSYDAA